MSGHGQRRFSCWCLLCLGLLTRDAQAITLVRDGKAVSQIVTADNPYPSQQVAAEELQYHLQRMTGATVPIVGERALGEDHGARIYVGQSDRLSALGIDTTSLPLETLIIKTADNGLILAGEDGGSKVRQASYADSSVRTGTLYAVYDFLQDQLGCRWLWPGRTGEFIPNRTTVEIGPLDVQETPQLVRRHFRASFADDVRSGCEQYVPGLLQAHADLWPAMEQEERLWLKRMRMGQAVKFSYGHAFTDWWDKYGKEHPEYFAQQEDGTRGLPSSTYPKEFVKLCVSNPEVVERLVQDFAARRAESPGYRWVNACENDGSQGFCRCPECRALDRPLDDATRRWLRQTGWQDAQIEATFGLRGDGLPGSLSRRYFSFYNQLARRVAEAAADASVVVYAYDRYRFAPADLKLEPNLLVGIIGFNSYPMTERQHRWERENYLAWKAAGVKQLFFRPNSFYYSPAHGIPWSAARQMGQDMQFLIGNGIVATDFDRLNGHWSTAAPTYYTVARLHWDPDLGASGALSEFYESFASAARDVAAYFDHWEQVFHRALTRPDLEAIARQIDPELGRSKAIAVLLTQEDFDTGRRLLQRARRAAGLAHDAELLSRLEVLELGHQHGQLQWRACQLANQVSSDRDVYFAERWPVIRQLFETRRRLAALHAHNIFYLSYFEVHMHDLFGTRVYHDFAGRPYEPVMTPSDTAWIFACDPKGSGQSRGWHQQITDLPDYFQRSRYEHLFFRNWDNLKAVTRWKQKTGKQEVGHGWYQVDLRPDPRQVREDDVLYLPCIRGTGAKVWVGGRLVREVSAQEIETGQPIVIGLSDAGIEPGKAQRLTIEVVSSESGGGLLGPPYIARTH